MIKFKDNLTVCTLCGIVLVGAWYSHQCPNNLPQSDLTSYVKPLNSNFNLACELKNGGIEAPETQNTGNNGMRNISPIAVSSSGVTGTALQGGASPSFGLDES